MKILSYNIYGKKDVESPVPNFNIRKRNLYNNINMILLDKEIKVLCFQEVNQNNMKLIERICAENNFKILDKFPMKTRTINQYNIIAIKNEKDIKINDIYCLPHGKDNEYKPIEEQIIDYGMSDYRTTLFVRVNYQNKIYLIGNIHTDYKSSEGIIKGTVKSLNYLDSIDSDYKLIIGDMNMVPHMSEANEILHQKPNYTTISKNNIVENSYHGYGVNESVNVDFAFVEKYKKNLYEYKILKQENIMDEGSDNRPVILTIN